MIASTLTKYKDSMSQQLVRNLVVNMLRFHHDAAVEGMLMVFKVLALKELANAPPNKSSKASLIALGWTVVLNKNANKQSNIFKDELPRLVEYQSHLYQIVLLAGNGRHKSLADNVMLEIFSDEYYYDYYKLLLLKKEPSCHFLITLLLLFNYKNDVKFALESMTAYKDDIVNYFIKAIISTKKKPPACFVTCCEFLLYSLTKEEFEIRMLPPMQRAVLRNPEIVLEATGLIIEKLNFDLSSYAIQLTKVVLPNLCSKNDTTRNEAAETLKQLSLKCASVDVITDIFKEVFEILNGSQGKVTVAEIRITILQVS